jgi:predicted Zn-dependent peptidase
MPDRSKAPPIRTISQVQLPSPKRYVLDNGIPVYEINKGTQDVIKIEVAFHAGRPYERQKLAARATASLIKEGTQQRDSAAISELVDFYGGTLSTPYNLDTSNIVLYSLNRHLDKLLPLLAEVVKTPSFPEDELKTYIEHSKQRLQVDLKKNDVVAYRMVTECIFGAEHPYGYNSYPDTYAAINRDTIIGHYKRNYTKDNCIIFVSGRSSPSIIEKINRYLGKGVQAGTNEPLQFPLDLPPAQKLRIPHPGAVQTAIRIGCRLFNRAHPDYSGMYVVNTILGGYFGSRLMMNIREDKGYTYNISSSIDTMRHDGCFYVGTEVGKAFAAKTKEEIYKEMRALQTTLIEPKELEMVRNYLLGNLLTMLDGPFNTGEVIKTIVLEDLEEETFDQLVRTFKTITPEEIQALAQRYLIRENMWEVVVG